MRIKNKVNHRYANASKKIEHQLYHQFCQLTDAQTIQKHQPQIKATIKNIYWFSADMGIPHLLFQAYSLIHHSKPNQFNRLKLIAKTNKINNEKAENDFNYVYYLIQEPIILELLWQNPPVRSLITTWLINFIKMKNKYGAEVDQNARYYQHFQNQFIQLLRGVNNHNQIKLPRYKNNPKKILDKETWQHRIYQKRITLCACWD